jgi:hypothetical protein
MNERESRDFGAELDAEIDAWLTGQLSRLTCTGRKA